MEVVFPYRPNSAKNYIVPFFKISNHNPIASTTQSFMLRAPGLLYNNLMNVESEDLF